MFISPTSNIVFQSGTVKLIGVKMEELPASCRQIEKLAQNHQIDLSILKRSSNNSRIKKDIYTIIATKEIDKEPYVLHGLGLSAVNKSADKEYTGLNILSAVLDAMDKLKQNLCF